MGDKKATVEGVYTLPQYFLLKLCDGHFVGRVDDAHLWLSLRLAGNILFIARGAL